jgi:hypothetical protein
MHTNYLLLKIRLYLDTEKDLKGTLKAPNLKIRKYRRLGLIEPVYGQ